jgi:glycosyltransferase involved in cell wall biosynthesis
MSSFKRIDRLKEHILSGSAARALTAELMSSTGRDDFFIVFLSVCNKKERARVFRGTGSTLMHAWYNAERSLSGFCEKTPLTGEWVKADIVTGYEEIPSIGLNKIMLKEKWINFCRSGISLDADFNTAFLEAEVNGNKLITYYTEREIADNAVDYNANRIHLENVNQYLKVHYGAEPVEHVPKKITIFSARGFFCSEDNQICELYSDGMDYGRRRVDEVTGDVVREVIVGASQYLARQIGTDGKFIYGYYPVFDNRLKNYNIVRHASTIWSLINLYRMSGDKGLIPRLDSAMSYMAQYIENKDTNTAYLVEKDAEGTGGEIKLGANGVAIIMYTEYMDVFRNENYVDMVRKLANGILEMQNPATGEYRHILEYPGFGRGSEYRTVYYDGEATFALARAYTYTKEQKYLTAAQAAIENFIAKNYIKHRDHWVAYALFEVTKYVNDVRYYEFALRNADENLHSIYNRATSYHTYLEMLMAAWRTYQRAVKYNVNSRYIREYNPVTFAQTIYFRARHMLNGCFYPEVAMYMKSPWKVAGSFMVRHHNFRVRIDDIQHFIGGYFFYSLYYNEIRAHLSEKFIRGLDASKAIRDIAEEVVDEPESEYVPAADAKTSAVYHLNKDFGGVLGAIEDCAVNRLEMFKNAGIKSKIITSAHNLNLHDNMKKHAVSEKDYENIYDFFQRTWQVKRKKISIDDLFSPDVYKWKKITYDHLPGDVDYKVYLSKKRIAYAHYENESTLVYINRFDMSNRRIKRCFYDCRGFLSYEKFLNIRGETMMEAYYTPRGEKVIEKYYEACGEKQNLTKIVLKAGGKWFELADNDALIAFYLDSIVVPGKDYLIADKNATYTKALTLMQSKVGKAAVLQARHTVGNDTHIDEIIDGYKRLFKSLDRFDAVVSLTKKQNLDVVRRYNNAKQMTVIPPAVPKRLRDICKQIPMTNAPKIITVARFERRERLALAILAFSGVVKKYREAEFHLFGSGGEVEKELRELISTLKLEKSVKLRGMVENMHEEFMSSKLYVATSAHEGFPLGLLEASAYGIPAVAFDIKYGPGELIDDGKTGFLTGESTDELADKIISLLDDSKLYEEFSNNAYTKAFGFDEEKIIDRWKKLFTKR